MGVFWAPMTILYLRYCAIYPPQVALQKRNKQKGKCLLILQSWNSLQSSTLSFWVQFCIAKRLFSKTKQGFMENWSWVHLSRCTISCMTESEQIRPQSLPNGLLTSKATVYANFCQQPSFLFFSNFAFFPPFSVGVAILSFLWHCLRGNNSSINNTNFKHNINIKWNRK